MSARPPRFLEENRVRWTPPDRLPMRTTELSRGLGALLVGLALPPGVLAASDLPGLFSRGDAGGVLLFAVLLAVFTLGTLWGVQLLWYRKTIVIDAQNVSVEIRGLRDRTSFTTPLRAHRAIARIDTQLHLSRCSAVVLLAPDSRSNVTLAIVPRGSSALTPLHDHFATLLRPEPHADAREVADG